MLRFIHPFNVSDYKVPFHISFREVEDRKAIVKIMNTYSSVPFRSLYSRAGT
jgi:hypothetical protein